MSHNYKSSHWGEIPDNRFSADNRNFNANTVLSQSNFPTSQSTNMSSQLSAHDNEIKLQSITDSDRFDSGIASLSLTEEDRERCLLEKIGETSEMCLQENSTHLSESGQAYLEVKDEFPYEKIPSEDNHSMGEKVKDFHEDCLPFIPRDGFSPLHISILDKETNKAIDFIQACPHPELLNFFTPEIHTALHLAVYSNLPEIVRFLIVYGADLNFRDRKGNTALHTACEYGHLACVEMLLSPLDTREKIGLQDAEIPQGINEKNYEGLTPLHLATMHNHWEVVNFLLQRPEINVNIGDSTSGRTALHHALERHSRKCFFLLLRTSANVNATTYDGCSPLHLSVGLGMEQETRCLMTSGANAYIETNDETRAWDLAKTQKLKDALQYSSLQMKPQAVRQR